jgi:CAAD domains of cyanobacterial aminoacyl-tRNA synthetase
MKTDIALHEIMRIDEQDDTKTEHISLVDPTRADAEHPTLGQPFMKSEESSTDTVDNAIVATEVPVSSPVDDTTVAEASPASRPDDTTAAQPVMVLHEAPSDTIDGATVAEKSPVSRPDDTTAASPVMSLHALPSDAVDTASEPVVNDTDSSLFSAETPAPESMLDDDRSPIESAEEIWSSIQTNTVGFFDEVVTAVTTFYQNNRQLLTTLGITLLAVLGIKLLFAGLNAIDDIPLVTPLLKLIGLVYVVRFVWRYLLREQNRHELAEKIEHTKTEVFGTQN